MIVKITGNKIKEVYVNPDHIIRLEDTPFGTTIHLLDGHSVVVDVTITGIAHQLNESTPTMGDFIRAVGKMK